MHILDGQTIAENLGWVELTDSLAKMFAHGCEAPPRHHHTLAVPGRQNGTMLLMPAWLPGSYAGLKVVNVFPDNSQENKPTIMGNYLLMDGNDGSPLALLDGGQLTARRTAAASALASRYLSRPDSTRLLIVGSGRLARCLGHAHAAVRPIEKVRIWARNTTRAAEVVEFYQQAGVECEFAENLAEASAWADIISCATFSKQPLIHGKWLLPGVHVDLIGAFTAEMRETDDDVILRADLFADTREGVMAEAGDFLQPMARGKFNREDIQADLHELTVSSHPGRVADDAITLFKSVGAALEDLAAAILCYENWRKKNQNKSGESKCLQ